MQQRSAEQRSVVGTPPESVQLQPFVFGAQSSGRQRHSSPVDGQPSGAQQITSRAKASAQT